MISANGAQREKKTVALSSVGAAVGLTSLKIIVALLTGSLGILAGAAHSGLNLVTALMTFFAVRAADHSADTTHHGHGKVKNLSAFLEAGLLLLTALWIIYQALRHIIYPEEGHVDANIWAFLVMVLAIAVDYTSSRALQRVAHKLGSQALEADALHFNTDIWSSLVVIVGLFIVRLSQSFPLPFWMRLADSFAAVGVSGIIIWASLQLIRETIDALQPPLQVKP
jgi:cation diffusion facilitator family transporter